jgi:hypothetical protein
MDNSSVSKVDLLSAADAGLYDRVHYDNDIIYSYDREGDWDSKQRRRRY